MTLEIRSGVTLLAQENFTKMSAETKTGVYTTFLRASGYEALMPIFEKENIQKKRKKNRSYSA